ncbi:MAG: DUF3592 domain-containing protein [Oscillibacter sp.]|nr:DUF3592 domain-containing protein [Oscillibacter sp.]
MDNIKGIIIWAVFLAVCAAIVIFGRRIRKQIDENGIEASGAVSRVDESYDSDTGAVTFNIYARYRTEDGDEIEGLLLNAPSNLQPGERVRVKYHPKLRTNAKLLNVVRE